jgi:hypothetical protein
LDVPHNETLESDLLQDPDDRTAHQAYAEWLRSEGHPWGEVIALSLAAEREPKHLRKLKTQAKQTLTRYVTEHLVPRYPRLAQRLLGFKLTGDAKGTDGLGSSTSESILWRRGFITSIETWCWKKPMRDQALELLSDPHARLLRNLCLRDQVFADLGSLSHLGALEELDFNWANVKSVADLSPLASLHRLSVLHLGRCAVTDLSPLRALPLRKLVLGGSAVSDLTPLAGHATLECLAVDATPVADVTPLLTCPRLCNVSLWDAKVPKAAAEELKQAMKANRAKPSGNADYEKYLSHAEINWYS